MKQRDIQNKIDFLLENFQKLDILKRYAFDEFSSNFERVDSVIHRVQTSIEALIDIGRYIIADLGLPIPITNSQVVEILANEGLIPHLDARRYIEMTSFRNRVVHEYDTIDIRLLYKILQEESNDLKRLLGLFLEIIKRHEDKKDLGGLRFF